MSLATPLLDAKHDLPTLWNPQNVNLLEVQKSTMIATGYRIRGAYRVRRHWPKVPDMIKRIIKGVFP